MFEQKNTSAQKILEEFPRLWRISDHYGPRDMLSVATMDGSDIRRPMSSWPADINWWVLGEYGESKVILTINTEFYRDYRLATAAIGTLYQRFLAYDVTHFVTQERRLEVLHTCVYKPKKGFSLNRLCVDWAERPKAA